MLKNAKTNSIRRNLRIAKKKAVVERGFGGWLSEACRWLNPSIFVYNNFDELKSLLDQLFQ